MRPAAFRRFKAASISGLSFCSRQVWVDPVYETRYDNCGNPIQVLVTPGHYRTVQTPGHWETRPRTIRHPGRWIYTCGH